MLYVLLIVLKYGNLLREKSLNYMRFNTLLLSLLWLDKNCEFKLIITENSLLYSQCIGDLITKKFEFSSLEVGQKKKDLIGFRQNIL